MTHNPYENPNNPKPCEVVSDAEHLAKIPWLDVSRYRESGYWGKMSEKYLLADEPRVVRIQRGAAYADEEHLDEAANRAGVVEAELNKLRNTYSVALPSWETCLVDASLQPSLPFMSEGEPVGPYDQYTCSDLIEGRSLDQIEDLDPELQAAIDNTYAGLIRYNSDHGLQDPEGFSQIPDDLMSLSQYVWGSSAANPDEHRLYMVDLDFSPGYLSMEDFSNSIFEQLVNAHFSLKELEDKFGVSFPAAREQLETSLAQLAASHLELTAEARQAMTFESWEKMREAFGL